MGHALENVATSFEIAQSKYIWGNIKNVISEKIIFGQ
jgi:hypothetical protein